MLDEALVAIDHSIRSNKRTDDLYHAYNLLHLDDDSVDIRRLYPMLEGQVAVLSSGVLSGEESLAVLDALFSSKMYRTDQKSFMLYPDRPLPDFLSRNRIPADKLDEIPVLSRMIGAGDRRIVLECADGTYRFNTDFANERDLKGALTAIGTDYGDELTYHTPDILALYERVFNHHAFTGRSGTMFGFEGLGCIYWHMVAKLLLAIQETWRRAADEGAGNDVLTALAKAYYRVRDGLGFNKTPLEYGAFPTDPYSHTPGQAGAQQPGMTGQVKEEILARFGELGIRVKGGSARFEPGLLLPSEFTNESTVFRYLDVDDNWQEVDVPPRSIAFSWCQVPLISTPSRTRTHPPLPVRRGMVRKPVRTACNWTRNPVAPSSGVPGRSGRFTSTCLQPGYSTSTDEVTMVRATPEAPARPGSA